MNSRRNGAMEVHRIHGTDRSFSSTPDDLDDNAVEALREIQEQGIDGMDGVFGMNPQQLPKGFFLAKGASYWKNIIDNLQGKKSAIWRPHGSSFGYGIRYPASLYTGFKMSYAYHKGNHKTNWIMNAYYLIHKNSHIKWDGVVLCHVFQSDNYNPRPKPFPMNVVPNMSDFHEKEMDFRMLQLEGLMNNPESFKDFYEFDEIDSKSQANGKRAEAWKHFTPIKVLGPDGEVMLTLAICHHCSMAYLTGKWDPKMRKVKNYGTNTLNDHYPKCSDQHHISGNP